MSTYMSREVLEGLTRASLKAAKKKTRMRVQAGEEIFPILKFSEESFSLESAKAPKLRGYVDILDGTRLKYRALIIASMEEENETVFEFKQATNIADGPALDFEKPEHAPVGYLSKL